MKRTLLGTLLTVCTIGLLAGCSSSGIQAPTSTETSAAEPAATTNGQTNTDTNIPTDTDTKKQEDSAMTSNDTATPLPSASGTQEAPFLTLDPENYTVLCLPRGSVDITKVTDESTATEALLISGRTESWNGVSFSADEFTGNTISVKATVKGDSPVIRISIQFDLNGSTAYNWIAGTEKPADTFQTITGTFAIPAGVNNVLLYIESDDTKDILLSEFAAEVVGEYTVPEASGETAAFADTSDYPSLKDTYADYFRMGVCVNPITVSKPEYSSLIVSQFNSVTNENNLKPEAIIDRAATLADVEANKEHFILDFSAVTGELDFAVANGLAVRGHTLIWHSQTPDFIFYEDYDPKGELAGRELMLKRMENYMCDVFTWVDANYPDLFYAWDIANECIDDNGGLRDSLWRQTIGDDYLEYAFAYARKYAPDSIALFYNDYNASQSGKQADIIAALTPVAEAGNLDGIGMQGHIDTTLSPARFTFAAKKYAESLSVIIHVTELDVVSPTGGSPETLQGLYYGRLFQALIDAKNSGVPIESVSIWGLTDSLSWKAGDKPLLFHDDLTPKTAFDEIIAAPF